MSPSKILSLAIIAFLIQVSLEVPDTLAAGIGDRGERNDIFMRRFDSVGAALGDPVMVNTFFEDDQVIPRVAVSGDGSFLVIWQRWEPDPDVGVGVGVDRIFIRSQAVNADGEPVGGERLLNTELTKEVANSHFADVAALVGGGYVVVWRSRNSPDLPEALAQQRQRRDDGRRALKGTEVIKRR